jgi:hypothetical protein
MSRSNFILPVVAFLGLLLFFFALVRILLLRYERGDVYPAYSTLRADPLGTRAYYEALDSVKGYSPERGFTFLHQELAEKPASVFYLGFDSEEISSFSKEEVAQLDAYVQQGGRVILTMSPSEGSTVSAAEKRKMKAENEAKKDTSDKKADDSSSEKADDATDDTQTAQEKYEREELRKEKEDYQKYSDPNPPPSAFHYHRSLAALWGFGWDNQHETVEKKDSAQNSSDASVSTEEIPKEKPEVMATYNGLGHMETSVPWKSALYFVRLEPAWLPLYYAKSQPVLIRRNWGKGEIIVASDSYFLSNEALRNNRPPLLLSYLAGPPGVLVFDETHLGTQQQEGVMFLMNQFRLEGYLYGALAVMVLFLWRNSCPLVPPLARDPKRLGGTVSGKDSRSGLVNLLRRNLGMKEILPASFAEWKRTVTPAQSHLKEKMEAMNETLSSANLKNPEQIIQTYHRLREINTSQNRDTYATKP